MSTFSVTAERLTIHEHPNADALEMAQVGGYRAVVKKGQYRTGDHAIYIPEQAVLPADLIEELGLTGRLAGKGKDRVKAVRLRGELSQGIVCTPSALNDVDLEAAAVSREDFTERLGVIKWAPEVPVHMSGDVEAAPNMLRWVDIENVKRHPDVFIEGEHVFASEKLHGTACIVSLSLEDDRLYVSSKGMNAKQLALKPDDKNLYWRAANGNDLETLLRDVAATLQVQSVAIFGEVYGAGVQDLTYGRPSGEPAFAAFDVAYVDPESGGQRFVDAERLETLLDGRVATVPVLYEGPYDEAALWAVASGPETVSGDEKHLREGVVVRPALERRSPELGGRAIVKFVSDDYLTRKGGTEYE